MILDLIIKTIVFYVLVTAVCWGLVPGHARPPDEKIQEFNNIYVMSKVDELQWLLDSPREIRPYEYNNVEVDSVDDLETLQFLDSLDD